MDKLRLIELFVHIVERGSLTAAAERAGVSVPTAVRGLATLERQVGTRLVERTTRQRRVTEEGREYYLRCRQILADIAAADDALSPGGPQPGGRIVVTAPLPFGRRHVAPLIAQFVEEHPLTRVELLLVDRVIDLLSEGVDMAVRLGRLPDSSLVSVPIGRTRVVTCASPGYLERHGAPNVPKDLARHACIVLLGAPSGNAWEFGRGKDRLRINVGGRFSVNQQDSVLDACIRGSGIARFFGYQVRDAVERGELQHVLQAFEPAPIPIQVVYPSARLLSARLRTLRDWLVPRLRTCLRS